MDMNETNNVVTSETPNPFPAQEPNPFPNQMPNQAPEKASGMAIAALICGICSIVFCCMWYISLITGVVAIILGIKVKKDNAGGQGMAKAGFICGIVGAILAVLYVVVIAGLLVGLNLT